MFYYCTGMVTHGPWQKPERPETPGGFGDLFEDMWGDFEDPQDSKKG